MALSILDGNQSATTLSTILTSGQHITAHTVVSLGTQAITDMRGAVSGSVVSISNFPATQTISGTVTANAGDNFTSSIAGGILSFQENDGFTINALPALPTGTNSIGSVTVGGGFISLTTGTSRIGVVTVGNSVTIGAGTVTIGAGTAQIGSVTASISGTVPVSISSVTVGNSVTIGSLPLIAGTVTANVSQQTNAGLFWIAEDNGGSGINAGAGLVYRADITDPNVPYLVSESYPLPVRVWSGSVTIGSLPAISGTVTVGAVSTTVTIAHHQGTSVTTSNFTSTTASTTLASANASREVLTIFSEGPGLLFVCPGATCTTAQYQVRLSAGDYYEVPLNQTSLTHSAVFATAGTARVTQVS